VSLELFKMVNLSLMPSLLVTYIHILTPTFRNPHMIFGFLWFNQEDYNSAALASPVDFVSVSYTTLPPPTSTPNSIAASKSEPLFAERTVNHARGDGFAAYGWTFIACFTDEINARALLNQVQIAGGPGAMTVENCNDRCEVDNYLLSGVEFGHECWCDHALNGEYHVKVDDSECNMECSAGTCGAANRIPIYENNFTQVVDTPQRPP
jgi:hypothetical protein